MEEEVENMVIECDCGAKEDFKSDTVPKNFDPVPGKEDTYSCPYCEVFSPEEPEGYERPVFTPGEEPETKPVTFITTTEENVEWLS